MYKLLIVEDEKTIAQGIARSIPWQEWGFQVAGICYNGREAVDFICKEKPDLVLSDIRMPQMNGMELMQFLNQNYPEIKIVILSGYNDFEYLQMSIRSHVAEYLLKPTDVDEFEVLFRRMKELLDQESKERKTGENLRLDQKCNNLLKGYGYHEEEIEEELYYRDTTLYGVILFRLENGNPEDNGLYYRQKLDTVEVLNNINRPLAMHFFCNYEEEIVSIICLEESDETLEEEQQIRQYALEQMNAVREKTGFVLSCGISCLYGDYRMLPQCYEQTKCSVSQNLFQDASEHVFFYHQIREGSFDYYQIAFDAERILKGILNQNEQDLEQELANTFDEFRNQMVKDYDYVNRMSMELLFNISRKMMKYNVNPERLMNESGYGYMDVYKKQSLEEKQTFLLQIFGLFIRECSKQQGKYSKTSELARLIKEIVDEEYTSNLISLEYVAKRVHKNAAYISRIFKNEFECNFINYVTEKRLEKSKELLEDPLVKIYEISQQLGWADVSNYIKVFKKKYGMSPDEYRRMLTGLGQHK